MIVTVRRVALAWTNVEDLFSWEWELYVVIWSPEQNLLFINSSTNSGEYKALAKAVAGETATLISGQQVFRHLCRRESAAPAKCRPYGATGQECAVYRPHGRGRCS